MGGRRSWRMRLRPHDCRARRRLAHCRAGRPRVNCYPAPRTGARFSLSIRTARTSGIARADVRQRSITALREPLTESAQCWSDDGTAMPAALNDIPPCGPEPVSREDERTGLGAVVELPCLLTGPVSAADAEIHLGMVAQVDHLAGIRDGAAAPTFRAGWLCSLERSGRRHGSHCPRRWAPDEVRGPRCGRTSGR